MLNARMLLLVIFFKNYTTDRGETLYPKSMDNLIASILLNMQPNVLSTEIMLQDKNYVGLS